MTKSYRGWLSCTLIVILVGCQDGDRDSTHRSETSSDSVNVVENEGSARANGERIFRNAVSRSNPPVRSTGKAQPDGVPLLSCGDCHGANGRGGAVSLEERVVSAPDIRFDALTRGRAEAGLVPYDEVTFGITLRTGITPDGRRLDSLMPRWRMGASDLNDLITYLKTLTPAPVPVAGE